MGLILVVILVLLLVGGVPFGMYQGPYAPHFGGGLGLVLIIVVVLLVLGRL